jgi:hypothetical protein
MELLLPSERVSILERRLKNLLGGAGDYSEDHRLLEIADCADQLALALCDYERAVRMAH